MNANQNSSTIESKTINCLKCSVIRNAAHPKGFLIQHHPQGDVRTGKSTSGLQLVKIHPFGWRSQRGVQVIPAEIAGLGAGKDTWLRNILLKCADCKERVPAGEMECGMCSKCYDKASEENAAADAR